jgi:hypothetical protein
MVCGLLMIGMAMLLSKEANHCDRRENHDIEKSSLVIVRVRAGRQSARSEWMESHHEQLALSCTSLIGLA